MPSPTILNLLTALFLGAWGAWHFFQHRSGLLSPSDRRRKNDVLPMPGLVYWGDLGVNAFITALLFLLDPLLTWFGYGPTALAKCGIVVLAGCTSIILGVWSASRDYLQRLRAAEASREAALLAMGFARR